MSGNDFMHSDLADEKVIIDGVKYTITHQPNHDPETNTISYVATREDGQEVILTYTLLDPNDIACYDIEYPSEISDL